MFRRGGQEAWRSESRTVESTNWPGSTSPSAHHAALAASATAAVWRLTESLLLEPVGVAAGETSSSMTARSTMRSAEVAAAVEVVGRHHELATTVVARLLLLRLWLHIVATTAVAVIILLHLMTSASVLAATTTAAAAVALLLLHLFRCLFAPFTLLSRYRGIRLEIAFRYEMSFR